LYAIQRYRSECALAHERGVLRALIDSLPDQIYIKDREHRFVVCNAAVATLMGRKSAEEMIGKSDYDFFPAELADRFTKEEREVLAGHPRVNREERIAGPWGEDCWLLITKVPLRDASGHIEGLVGVNRDITERKKAEDKLVRVMSDLTRSNAELRSAQLQLFQAEKMETLGRLAAGIAHEVKNPLAVAFLGLDYLQNATAGESPVVKEVIVEIYDAIRRADSVVGGLLDFSRPSTLVLKPETLNNLVEQTLALLKHEFLAKNIIVTRELSAAPQPLSIDAHKIKQVLMNLILNAVHALSEYGMLSVMVLRGKVGDLRRERAGFNAERLGNDESVEAVCIEDNGPGISGEHLPRIFEPFFTTKPSGQGTGLGLSVARQIVDMHGGVLDIRNRHGGGVSATLILKTAAATPLT
jgi:PAS domain S-box-containing protein